jgi:hypothetical protein
MNIRPMVIEAVLRALIGQDCAGFMKRTYVMVTSPKWSAL